MQSRKILIAGTNSGVGKTTISLGIMQALKNRNMVVQPYKVGPDYIDTAYHTHITKRASRNLDAYMLEEEKLKYLFNKVKVDADISVVEGVMGLYDGKGTDINNCSSSSMAKLLNIPVILVINAKAMAASSAAMVLGYQKIDPDLNICGVIANNVRTEGHYKLVKESIEKYCGVEVLGYFPPNESFSLPSRHLGLVPSNEMEALDDKFQSLGSEIEKYINIDRLLELCETEDVETDYKPEIVSSGLTKVKGKKIAIAQDKAFNFYYADNLDLLRDMGLEIVNFSPLYDKELPVCDYIYIGGGFPEVFGKELAANKVVREAIKKAHEAGIPIYAECGGLMYLGEGLIDHDENYYEMVGIFEGVSRMTKSLKRFGYCYGTAQEETILSKVGDTLRGHEFHHSEFESKEKGVYIMQKGAKAKEEDKWSGGYSKGNTLAAYLHIHFYSNLEALAHFLIEV
ncbi:cobyrinate a,c-diamide synthase [Cellulosilyticum ruminicola]|uniref:cobyrinate a,c-diamide synthase n=1 Tax=Cellulosilyticum ruminicola TaxID=425254 RepID=UPI0006D0BF6D|nr:cobyrinate a,c-diamide synthase [Cellulosilyticum ruminicola]